ncbi:NAD(P)/FAD-dependent oxidoreductase [Pantoea ananatis]|uniref:NAD(P)/FAD-dependent oxidoreductase n=1 Tax=Pantoea ananas TaxID=553 RepID=UPI0011A1BB16|nr:FAD-dependent oxidoreductase [Pantoea ananatis]
MQIETDVAVIGGGLVGIAVAYGLAKRGLSSVVLDEGDSAIRASRGNFGLVWVQGKGEALPAYTGWALRASRLWPQLSQELLALSGIDVALSQAGGLYFCQSPEDLEQRRAVLEKIGSQVTGPYEYEILDNAAARKLVPQLGEHVAGASYSRYDGHVSPIRLLQALHRAYQKLGGSYLPDNPVDHIEHIGNKYRLKTPKSTITARKIVLAAGLGNAKMGDLLGVSVPVKPIRGQIMVTERLPPLFTLAMEQVRQTDNGSLLLGSSWEDVGLDLNTTYKANTAIARSALQLFPFLRNVRVVRSWSALRIMSPDASPIYDEVSPGAFLVTCHSGVSLAAIHVFETAGWVADGKIPLAMRSFRMARFSAVSA